jgi:membrane associated rhomboid family serine protease
MNGLFNPAGFGVWFGQARLLIDLLVVMWLVAIVNFSLLPGVLSAIGGLKPRRLIGIPGIFLSPFLHSDWEHLLGNSTAYLIFGGMMVCWAFPAHRFSMRIGRICWAIVLIT